MTSTKASAQGEYTPRTPAPLLGKRSESLLITGFSARTTLSELQDKFSTFAGYSHLRLCSRTEEGKKVDAAVACYGNATYAAAALEWLYSETGRLGLRDGGTITACFIPPVGAGIEANSDANIPRSLVPIINDMRGPVRSPSAESLAKLEQPIVWVHGVHPSVTEDDIEDLFSHYPGYTSCRFLAPRTIVMMEQKAVMALFFSSIAAAAHMLDRFEEGSVPQLFGQRMIGRPENYLRPRRFQREREEEMFTRKQAPHIVKLYGFLDSEELIMLGLPDRDAEMREVLDSPGQMCVETVGDQVHVEFSSSQEAQHMLHVLNGRRLWHRGPMMQVKDPSEFEPPAG